MEEIILNIFGFLVILLFLYVIFGFKIRNKYMKPKYKLDKDGYLMFYYPYYHKWEYFPLWDNNETERIIKVFDRVKDCNYEIKYKGAGRCKVKVNYDCYPVPLSWLNTYIREKYPYYKNAERLWNEHCILIDRENDIIVKIAANKIFS